MAETVEHVGSASSIVSLPGGQLQQNVQAAGVDEGMIFVVSPPRERPMQRAPATSPAEDGVSV